MKIEEYDPASIQMPIVNANCLITPVHKKYIAIITRSVDTTVPKDLLIVCHRLSSNILPMRFHFCPALFFIFSLILSKMIMVSFMLYPIQVNTAITNTVSMAIVLSSAIQNPYAHAGIHTSNIMVMITTTANKLGEISFLIPANENS